MNLSEHKKRLDKLKASQEVRNEMGIMWYWGMVRLCIRDIRNLHNGKVVIFANHIAKNVESH
jgi:hypothetical protein